MDIAAQHSKITPSFDDLGIPESEFGGGTLIDGNRALVAGVGVNYSGAVYDMEYKKGSWQKKTIIMRIDTPLSKNFVLSVSLSADRAQTRDPKTFSHSEISYF